jgi:hypothetical protein
MADGDSAALVLTNRRTRRIVVGAAAVGVFLVMVASLAGNGPLHAAGAAASPGAAPDEIVGGNQCHCYGYVSDAISDVPRYYDPGSAGCAVSYGFDPSDPGACQVWASVTVVEPDQNCSGAYWDVEQVQAGLGAGANDSVGTNAFEIVDTCGGGGGEVSFDDYTCQAMLADGCPDGPSGYDGETAVVLGAAFYGPAPATYDPNPYVVTSTFHVVPLGDCQGTTTGYASTFDPIVLDFSNCASYYADQPDQPSGDDNNSSDNSDNYTGVDWNGTGWEPCDDDNEDCADAVAGDLQLSTGAGFAGGTACTACAASWVSTIPITYGTENDTLTYVPAGTYHWSTDYTAQGTPVSSGVLSVAAGVPDVVNQTLLQENAVTFSESGLPAGTPWTVSLGGANFDAGGKPSVAAEEPNGTYPYLVWGPTGYAALVGDGSGSFAPSSGLLTVNGSTTESVTFMKAKTGTLTFAEKGLAKGTERCIDLGLSGLGQLTASCSPNGTVKFTGLPSPPGGAYSYAVVGPTGTSGAPGSGLTGPVLAHPRNVTDFSAPTYTTTVHETGLPADTKWHIVAKPCVSCGASPVKLKSASASGPGSSLTLSLFNGTYGWSVTPVPGYAMFFGNATGWDRVLTVNGFSQTLNVTFLPEVYNVTFTESGLAAGTNWSVTIGGAVHYSTSSTISVLLTNGTYKYTLGPVSGYAGAGSPTTVKVHAKPVAVSVEFKSTGGGTG